MHHGVLPTVPIAAVQGIVVYPRDVPRSTLDESRLYASLSDVCNRMQDAHRLTFDILPIINIDARYTAAEGDEQQGTAGFPRLFNETAQLFEPCLVPTYAYVVGSKWSKLPNANYGWAHSIGSAGKWCVGATVQATIVMHELGHVWTGQNHTGTPPREVKSWFGFGPSTYVYDIMSTNPIPYDFPLEQCEFNQYHVGILRQNKHLVTV